VPGRGACAEIEPLLMMRFHDLNRFLGAKERPREIGGDHRLPALQRYFFQRHAAHANAGIVEQEVEPAEHFLGFGKQRQDRGRLADVGRYH
jgi:hypothetical protein